MADSSADNRQTAAEGTTLMGDLLPLGFDRLDERRFLALRHLSFLHWGKMHYVCAGTEIVWPTPNLPAWLETARLGHMVEEITSDGQR